jgi:hypothetical protein
VGQDARRHYHRAAIVRTPFLDALRAGLKLAESADAAKYGFKPGDVDHLRRWLNNKRAAAIFAKLTKNKTVTQRRIVILIQGVLSARQGAETTDKLNATFAELKREKRPAAKKARRNAMKQFADGDVSRDALDDYLAFINQVESRPSNLDPLFTVRSDRAGSRKRTIFCRILSDLYHTAFGRWHDAEVAALCNIAFDYDGVTVEAVKLARKGLTPRSRRSRPR